MKRFKQLHFLSWDHRSVLLESFNILKYADTLTDQEIINKKTSTLNIYENDLLLHFRAEEELLLSRIILKKDVNVDLIKKTLDDHIIIHSLIVLLKKETLDIQRIKTILKELAKSLNDHIRFEERQLFEHAQLILDNKDFDDIEREIIERYGNKYLSGSCELPELE